MALVEDERVIEWRLELAATVICTKFRYFEAKWKSIAGSSDELISDRLTYGCPRVCSRVLIMLHILNLHKRSAVDVTCS